LLIIASMGPPLWRGGKAGYSEKTAHVTAQLQWGRPCGGAERKPRVVENPLIIIVASMGPPLWRGGKVAWDDAFAAQVKASMGPPLWRGGKASAGWFYPIGVNGFNGAAPVEGRKESLLHLRGL